MAVGDIKKTALMVVEKVLVKANEDIEAGEVIYDDGAGFVAAPNTVTTSKLYVAMEAHDYSAESEHYIRALPMGCIEVQKVAGAIREGDLVMISSTTGAVTKYVAPVIPAGTASTYFTDTISTAIQTAVDTDRIILGTCAAAAASGDEGVDVWVGVK